MNEQQLDAAFEKLDKILGRIGNALGTMHKSMVDHGVSQDTAERIIAEIAPEVTAKLTGGRGASLRGIRPTE